MVIRHEDASTSDMDWAGILGNVNNSDDDDDPTAAEEPQQNDEDEGSDSESDNSKSSDSNDDDDEDAAGSGRLQGLYLAPGQEPRRHRLVDMDPFDENMSPEERLQKTMRIMRIILKDCRTEYESILNGTSDVQDGDSADADATDGQTEASTDANRDPDFARGYCGLVNGSLSVSEPTPPPTPTDSDPDPDLQPQQQQEGDSDCEGERGLVFANASGEFDSDVDTTLPVEEQVKSLMAETRALKIDNYMLKEVISYQLRLVSLQSGHIEQRDARSWALESEVKELKTKLTGIQDEMLAMKSNQNLIGRHEQATQTQAIVYPITITPRPKPKVKPSSNSTNSAGGGGGGELGPGRPSSAGGRNNAGGSGNSINKVPKPNPKLPEPNNITHRTPAKYQYGQGQRIPFGSSASPVKKKSPSPKKVSDHENDGDDDDDDDEPETPATRSSNHHTNTYSRKPKMISLHRRTSASSTDSSASESRPSPRRVIESTATSTSGSGRVTPTRSRRLSSPPIRHSSPRACTGSGSSSPVRIPSPVRVQSQSPPPATVLSASGSGSRGSSPAKMRSPQPPRSPPPRQPSPIRQPSPPRGRLSSLRRTGKDKLYFTPMRSPSKSRMQKNKQQQQVQKSSDAKPKQAQAPEPSQNHASSYSSSQSRKSAEKATTRRKSKSKSPSSTASRPKSIPISREASSSPNLFSADTSSSSSASNSLSKVTDDEYDNLFSQFRKYRQTPIMVTSAAEARLNSSDGSVRKSVLIKSSPLSLRKDDYVKQSKTVGVRLDRALTIATAAAPALKMRPLDYDWTIPSRPIPFVNDGQKPSSSTSNLVKTALRRKRISPTSKDDLAKKIRMMRFSKSGMKGTSEKDLRSYIAQKYEVKKQVAAAKVEEDEEEGELYDIEDYIEPMPPHPPPKPKEQTIVNPIKPLPLLSKATAPSSFSSTAAKTATKSAPKSKAAVLAPTKAKKKTKTPNSTSTTIPSTSTKIKIKKSKLGQNQNKNRTSTEEERRLTPHRRVSGLSWPPRSFTNRHDESLMTDNGFYAFYAGSTRKPVGEGNDNDVDYDDGEEVHIIAEFEDLLGPPTEEEKRAEQQKAEVPVPSWRAMKFAPMKSRQLQLDEDCDDAVYERRHAKWEIDERRRKRWDAQKQREEEYTAYLREREAQKAQRALMKRYSRTTWTTWRTGDSAIIDHDDTPTLLPDISQAKFVLVDDNLPVTALGQPVPNLSNPSSHDFKRPWKDRNEEDGPEEEVDIILPVTIKTTARPRPGQLAIKAGGVSRRKPSSTSSRGQSPGPGPSGLLAIEGPSTSAAAIASTSTSKDTKFRVKAGANQRQPKLRPPSSDDDMDVD